IIQIAVRGSSKDFTMTSQKVKEIVSSKLPKISDESNPAHRNDVCRLSGVYEAGGRRRELLFFALEELVLQMKR
ncbi:hypothetical protein PFISCL1PPCAC_16691, partial [Pristionchus fissidentatus]